MIFINLTEDYNINFMNYYIVSFDTVSFDLDFILFVQLLVMNFLKQFKEFKHYKN